MSVTDPIADFFSRIKNAIRLNRESMELPSSKIKVALCALLKDQGFISEFEVVSKGAKKTIRLSPKYVGKRKAALTDIVRVSRPGRRVYVASNNIPKVQSGYGVCVMSTPKGLMTDSAARKSKMGGEVLCKVW